MDFYVNIVRDEFHNKEYTDLDDFIDDVRTGNIDFLDLVNEDYVNDLNEYIWDSIETGIIKDPSMEEQFGYLFDITEFLFTREYNSELIEFDLSSGVAVIRRVYKNPYTQHLWAIDMEESSISSEMIEPFNFYQVVPYDRIIAGYRPINNID